MTQNNLNLTEESEAAPCVASRDLFCLLERMRHMAATRHKSGDRWHAKGDFDTGETMHMVANCYDRCARELERVLTGESPPGVGEAWPDPHRDDTT